VAAGAGNNGADALVMLRYFILAGLAEASSAALVIARVPETGDTGPCAEILRSLEKMNVRVLAWGDGGAGSRPDDVLAGSDIIIDGIAGTGVKGALGGTAAELAKAVNYHRASLKHRPFVVSVDIPSGNSDQWEAGMPIVEADATLAIEPRKLCLYTPAARARAGVILPVGGVFPPEITESRRAAELIDWESAGGRIRRIRPDAYKHERGTVEIRAGSPGATGAALIAARGAQAAGAGLVRLVADDDIYPILASRAGGVMVVPALSEHSREFAGRFPPDAALLGPGWGTGAERAAVLEKALALEKEGVPLILDADAIELAKNKAFNGRVILTPHPGELSKFTGVEREELLNNPVPALMGIAEERKALVLFKSHVIFIAAPDGRLGVADGMVPGLAAGGSGDLLAGFCAAIAARMAREGGPFDAYACAAAASALLMASARSIKPRNRFTDPLELADAAANLAGEAWLNANFGNNTGNARRE
jgi:NAD(P)H-hydrate epimerase